MRTMPFILMPALLLAAAVRTAPAAEPAESRAPDDAFSWLLVTYEHSAEFEEDPGAGGEASITEADLASPPLVFGSEPWQTAVGLGANWTRLEFSGTSSADLDLYTLAIPLDLLYTGEDWSFYGNVTPELVSDFEELGSRDARALLHAAALYAWTTAVDVVLGAAYDRIFGKDQLYPLCGVIWRIGESWRVDAVFPEPRVIWAPTERFLLFADMRPAGDVWNVEEEGYGEYDLKLEGYRIGLGCELGLMEHVWLHVAAGASLDRSYEVHVEGESVEYEADDTFFARAGLVFR